MEVIAAMTRIQDRALHPADTRIAWAEQDLDLLDQEIAEIKKGQARMTALLFGVFVSTTTGSLMLVITTLGR